MTWRYDEGCYSQATVAALSASLATSLQALIRQGHESEGVAWTPSDFPEAELNQAALDQLVRKLGRKG